MTQYGKHGIFDGLLYNNLVNSINTFYSTVWVPKCRNIGAMLYLKWHNLENTELFADFFQVLKLILNGSKWSKHTLLWVWGTSEMWLSSHDASWKTQNFLKEFRRICSKVPLTLFTLDMMFQRAVALFYVNLRDIEATFQLKWLDLENKKSSAKLSQ